MSIANPKNSILRKNPYADRRSFIARMNPLSPIGDIANATLTEGVGTGAITWETAMDWDNAVSESGVVHESTTNTDHDDASVVAKGYPKSTPNYSSDNYLYHPFHEDSGSTAYGFGSAGIDGALSNITQSATGVAGTTAYDFNGSSSKVTATNGGGFGYPFSYSVWVAPDSISNSGNIMGAFDASSNSRNHRLMAGWQTNSIEFVIFSGSNIAVSIPSSKITLGSWHHIYCDYDGSVMRIFLNGVQEDSTSIGAASPNPDVIYGDDQGYEGEYDGRLAEPKVYTRQLTATEIQNEYDAILGESILETATKSFASLNQPNLQNLSYSLNSQSVTLDVIGSPGTASEEIVTQTLDGSASYSLTWSDSHTDFRIRMRLSSTDAEVSPTVSRMELA